MENHSLKKPTSLPTDEFPFLTDWIVISFRWMGLVALAIPLTPWDTRFPPEYISLLLLGLWNLVVTIFSMMNKRLPAHRLLNVIVDFAACSSLFFFTGGLNGPMMWVGILPLFSSAIYFEWWGIFASIFINTSIVTLWVFTFASLETHYYQALVIVGIYILLGIFIGVISRTLLKSTRHIYRKKVSTRQTLINTSRRMERKRMKTFFEMVLTLSGTLDSRKVLDSALELCLTTLETSKDSNKPNHLSCAFLLSSDDSLKIAASRGFPPRDMRISLPGKEGVIYECLRHREWRLISNPGEDVELKQLITVHKYPKILCLPLLYNLEVFGVLLICHPSPKFYSMDRIEMLELICHQVTISLNNSRLFHELEIEKAHIIETQDEIRKELARELHDGPTQTVSAIAMRSSIAKQLLERDVEEAKKELASIETLARSTTNEIRHMLFTLRPLVLETEGLLSALKVMAQKMKETFQQEVNVNANEDVIDKLEPSKQTVIFYIAEEAVNNARKHAQADHIQVSLNFVSIDKRLAVLEIVDNGVGFDLSNVAKSYENRGSLGLLNLQERTELINGMLRIDSSPGMGTRVRVYIPLTKDAIELLQQNKKTKSNLPILVEK